MSNICAYFVNSEEFKKSGEDRYLKEPYLNSFLDRACFYELRSIKQSINHIVYVPFLPRNEFEVKTARWFISELKKWGFEFEKVEIEKLIKYKRWGVQFDAFKVDYKKLGGYRKSLATLTALRYLDKSENLYRIINDTYEWSIKFPNIDTFLLFQLAHFIYEDKYKYGFNYNHTFLGTKCRNKLCSLKNFWKEIDNNPLSTSIENIMNQKELSLDEREIFKKLLQNEQLEEITNDYLSK